MFTSQTNSATETQPTHLGQPTTLQEEMKTTEVEEVEAEADEVTANALEPEAGGMSADALEDLQRAASPASLPRAVAEEGGAACCDHCWPHTVLS